MINLRDALMNDIREGLDAARGAGALPAIKKVTPIVVEHPESLGHGDYASPVALVLAKKLKKQPMEFVEAIAKHMPKKEYVGKLEAVEPGFLNIWIHEGWMADRLDDIVEQDLCAGVHVGKGKMANLEFISANPTGPLTLGNARTAFSADVLGNIFECSGYNVTREYYVNDAGEQIRRLGESVLRRILQEQGEKVTYSDDLYQGAYIREIGRTISERWEETEGKRFTKKDLHDKTLLQRISEEAMELCLSSIKQSVKEDLRIEMDVWISERALRESGVIEKALDRLRTKGETYKKGGTEFLKTSKYGDDQDRVLVKKDGEYAYIAPDIAYHQGKYDRKYDLIFTFLGADHQGHVPKLRAAMEALGNDVSKLHIIVGQWLRLVRGGKQVKLSKRSGQVVTPKDLIDEVGYDAARYFMVQHSLSSHMDFDLDLAKEKSERNPVYYIQYAFVRLQSILRKAKEQEIIETTGDQVSVRGRPVLQERAEVNLMLSMYRWPEVVGDITRTFEVQQLPYYAHDLAKAVHVFYKQVPVLAAEDEKLVHSRLQLVLAARKVLGATLDLLGVGKPDVM